MEKVLAAVPGFALVMVLLISMDAIVGTEVTMKVTAIAIAMLYLAPLVAFVLILGWVTR